MYRLLWILELSPLSSSAVFLIKATNLLLKKREVGKRKEIAGNFYLGMCHQRASFIPVEEYNWAKGIEKRCLPSGAESCSNDLICRRLKSTLRFEFIPLTQMRLDLLTFTLISLVSRWKLTSISLEFPTRTVLTSRHCCVTKLKTDISRLLTLKAPGFWKETSKASRNLRISWALYFQTNDLIVQYL